MKAKNQVKRRRKFTEEFKKSCVRDFERGKLTVLQMSKNYDIHDVLIYRWIRKYSVYSQKGFQVVVEKKSLSKKNKELRDRIAALEATLGRKQMEIEYFQKLVELSSEELEVDLKKKVDTVLLNGSGSTGTATGGK